MRIEFTLVIVGEGDNVDEAWEDAVEAFTNDPGEHPDQHEKIDD
jgi:hypothetical protein